MRSTTNKQTKTEDGITTHYYDLVTGDKPAVEPNEKRRKAVTRLDTRKRTRSRSSANC